MLVKSNAVDIIVIDSVAALVPRAEVEGEIGDSHVGLQARLMSQALRILNPTIAKHQDLHDLHQPDSPEDRRHVRQPGNHLRRPGAEVLQFGPPGQSARSTAIKEGEETVGSRVKVKVVKNKVAPPFRQAEFDLMHDRGISREGDLLDLAIEDKIIDKSGSWLNYGELRLGQGRENAKQYLRDNPALMEEITRKILEKRGLTGPAAAKPEETNGEAAKHEPAPTPTKAGRKHAAAASAD